jgi:iron(III) transport system permease protein
MRPGLFAGGTIVLIWSFTELGTPLMFDFYDATPVQIFHRIAQISGNPVPYALVIVMLVVSVLLYVTGRLVLGRRQDAAVTKASVQGSARTLGPVASLPVLLPFLIVSGLALLPHVGVISCRSVAWARGTTPRCRASHRGALRRRTDALADPAVGAEQPEFASLSMVIDMVLGLLIAVIVVRSKLPAMLRQAIDSVAMLPLAVPGLVLAFGYLAISLRLKTWVSIWDKHSPHDLSWLLQLVDVQENPTLLLSSRMRCGDCRTWCAAPWRGWSRRRSTWSSPRAISARRPCSRRAASPCRSSPQT